MVAVGTRNPLETSSPPPAASRRGIFYCIGYGVHSSEEPREHALRKVRMSYTVLTVRIELIHEISQVGYAPDGTTPFTGYCLQLTIVLTTNNWLLPRSLEGHGSLAWMDHYLHCLQSVSARSMCMTIKKRSHRISDSRKSSLMFTKTTVVTITPSYPPPLQAITAIQGGEQPLRRISVDRWCSCRKWLFVNPFCTARHSYLLTHAGTDDKKYQQMKRIERGSSG